MQQGFRSIIKDRNDRYMGPRVRGDDLERVARISEREMLRTPA